MLRYIFNYNWVDTRWQ